MTTIGIRREPEGCRAAPLLPAAVAALVAAGHVVRVAGDPARLVTAESYAAAGAAMTDDLSGCDLTVGIRPASVAGDPSAAWAIRKERP